MQLLDSKDYIILNYLINNSRTSYTLIAKTERIPLSVVKYRVERLKEHGIIKQFNAIIDYTKLGYTIHRFHIILQYTSAEMKNKIIQHFSNYNLTVNIYNTRGKYDLVVTILENDPNEFFSFYEKSLKKFCRYFREFNISNIFEIYVDEKSQSFINNVKNTEKLLKNNTHSIEKIDSLDYKILDLLSRDSRISSLEISKILKVSTTTVIRHINELANKGIILNYSIIVDSKKLGYKQFIIYLSINDYNKKEEIIRYLSTISSIGEIYCGLGNWNVELLLLTPSFEHFITLMEKIKNRYIQYIRYYDYVFIDDTFNTYTNLYDEKKSSES